MSDHGVLRFGDFIFDPARQSLDGLAGPITLRRKSADLLLHLLRHADRVVGKEELITSVWPDVTVSDELLTQCISELRRALGAAGDGIIRTIPRRGYRIDVPVIAVRADETPPTQPPAPLPLPDKPSLVVLPFANMSGDPEQDYFADGMVEDITTALSRIRSLFVIARNSAFTYKGRTVDTKQVGRELGVHYVLEGSVRKAANRVRITGQLVEAESGTHIWANRFDGDLEDIFALQDRVTTSVVAAIAPAVRTAEIARAQRAPTNSPQAYDLLLRALSHFRSWTRAGFAEAVRLLRQAITIDPNYALGYAHLSAVFWMTVSQGWIDRADPTVTDMLDLARTALTLDGEDSEILIIVGTLTGLPGGDFSGGITLVNKAIALNPNSAVALRAAGNLYARAGDPARALASLDQAERLDPFDNGPTGSGYSAHIVAHFVTGAYDVALEWTDKSLRDRPRSAAALRYRAACLGLLGRLDEARQTIQRLREVVPDFTIARARRHIEFDMNGLFGKPSDAEAFYEGLRRAGVPEG